MRDAPLFAQRLAEVGEAVEQRLRTLLSGDRPGGIEAGQLGDAMRYAVLGGGKRLRPFLLVETAALFGVAQSAALNAAAAVECIHCYSLVHDDLPAMDDDDVRRGRATVHRAFDEATAILAGDGLLTLAFEILGRPDTHADIAVRLQLVGALARASGWEGMVGGQQLDLEAENDPQQDLPGIVRIQALKTGALIGFAVTAGAMLGRASAEELRILSAYADKLGLAFQVADDILDAEGDPAVVGKATRKDAAAGKATFVSLLGLEAARVRLRRLEEEAVATLAPLGGRAAVLQETARFVARRRS
jgi:farnesyl diphosphate synthase